MDASAKAGKFEEAQAVLERALELGLTLQAEGGAIRCGPASAAPADFVESVKQCKSELLSILSTWPPNDADDLVEQWKQLGQPEIPLSLGVALINLERWFRPAFNFPTWCREDIGKIRRYLETHTPAEGQQPSEVPPFNLSSSEWRRHSIPLWQQKLDEAEASSDTRGVKYATWMLSILSRESPRISDENTRFVAK